MGHRRLTKQIVIDALNKTKGAVYLAAKSLECSHTAIYNYIAKYPDIAELKEYYDEEVSDIAVLKLRDSVIKGEPWAIKYQLSTKGKSRGYVERQEVTGKDGGAIVVDWDGIDSNQD